MVFSLPTSMKVFGVAAAFVLVSCQTTAAHQPAVLEHADNETMARLSTAAAKAMGKSRIEIGAADLTRSPEIPVLPPRLGPFEMQSPAIPTYFDLTIEDGKCWIVKRSSGEVFEAEGVSCKPFAG